MGLHQALEVLHRLSLQVSANIGIQVAFPLCFHPLMSLSACADEIPSDCRLCSSRWLLKAHLWHFLSHRASIWMCLGSYLARGSVALFEIYLSGHTISCSSLAMGDSVGDPRARQAVQGEGPLCSKCLKAKQGFLCPFLLLQTHITASPQEGGDIGPHQNFSHLLFSLLSLPSPERVFS